MARSKQTKIVFPPYGVLNQDEAANLGLRVPTHWMPPPGAPGGTPEKQWSDWLDGVIAQINRVIWPCWDSECNSWIPAESVEHMEALTRADLCVLQKMEPHSNRGLDTRPNSPNRSDTIRPHRQIFIIEDDRALSDDDKKIPFASYYDTYDSALPKGIADSVRPLFFNSLHQKVLNTPYQVKARLQRPRPYQTALLLGFPAFVNEVAQTGLTPSSCSGHCLQGAIGMGGVYEFLIAGGVSMDAKNLDSMRQYAMDIGDRRVMAGVHYPSDNLCSWIIALHLADRVYRNPSVKPWLWQAISTRSAVYAAIRDNVGEPCGKALKPAWDYMHSLAPAAK